METKDIAKLRIEDVTFKVVFNKDSKSWVGTCDQLGLFASADSPQFALEDIISAVEMKVRAARRTLNEPR